MKITVIGFWGAYPKAGEATSGYLLEKDQFRLLIDCGSGVVSQLQKYCSLNELDAVILSHYHHDHMADIGVLQYARMINISAGLCNKLLPIYGHTFDQESFQKLSYESYVKAYPYNPEKTLEIGPFTISFLKTIHPVPCCAMRITDGVHTIVYTADTELFPELALFAKDCDLLITECSFFEEQQQGGGHLRSVDVGEIANVAKPKQILLSHLPHFGDHKLLLKQVQNYFPGNVELARTGWTKSFVSN